MLFIGRFNLEAGKVRRRFCLKQEKNNLSGTFSFERSFLFIRTTFAIYLKSGELYFMAGKHTWALSDKKLSFSFRKHENSLLSSFYVLENSVVVWHTTYFHPFRTLYSKIDPTYDEFDINNDHFLLFVAQTALDKQWQNGAIRQWGSCSGT